MGLKQTTGITIMLGRLIRQGAIGVAVLALSAGLANAQTMTLLNTSAGTVDGLMNLGTAGFNGYVSGTAFTANFVGFNANVGFTGASGIVHGANIGWNHNGIGGGAWAPAVGGAAITTNYMVASSGTITLNLSSSVSNFQFLWGSPGFGDVVTLYSGAVAVAQFTGAQVNAANVSFNNAVGTTVITDLQTGGGVTFDKVAISNPTSNFEFALQTTQATQITAPTGGGGSGTGTGNGVVTGSIIPSPAPVPMLGATLFGNLAALIGMIAMWKKRYSRRLFLVTAQPTQSYILESCKAV